MTTSKQADERIPNPDEAEARKARRRLLDAEPDVVEPASAPQAEQARAPEPDTPRRSGWKVIERVPIRPESLAEERARYPVRDADHKRRALTWLERQTPEAQREDIAHRTTCEVQLPCPHPVHDKMRAIHKLLSPAAKAKARRALTTKDRLHLLGGACEKAYCQHPSHVRQPREAHTSTRHDQRHLMFCLAEEGTCPTQDDSHLLPPRPLDVKLEFCCEQKCYPAGSLQAITSCMSLRPQVRKRRQAELRRDRHAFGNLRSVASGEAEVVRVNHLSPMAQWGLAAGGSVYDSATTSLGGPVE